MERQGTSPFVPASCPPNGPGIAASLPMKTLSTHLAYFLKDRKAKRNLLGHRRSRLLLIRSDEQVESFVAAYA